MSNTLLKVDNLHVYYGSIHAIKGISFEVNEGEIVTLIGANGAGKSTTLNTVAGLLKPRSGSILLHDQNIVGVPADKIVSKGMALCPEGRRIFLQMTVLENLEMGGYTRPNSELEESIENVYDHFPRLKERYKQVAGGGDASLLEVASHGLVDQLLGAVFRVGVKAHLNSLVAVGFDGFLLHHLAGAGLHHGHGYEAAIIGENLRHADFLAYDRFLHDVVTSCISC